MKQSLLPLLRNQRESCLEGDLTVLNWNISNPSFQRARQQIRWITDMDADVIILTEAKLSQGSQFLRDELELYGYRVFFPEPDNNGYCTLVATKDSSSYLVQVNVEFLPCRAVFVRSSNPIDFDVVGIYVPSRGPKQKRNLDKRRFQYHISSLLRYFVNDNRSNGLIVGGDLNVVERNHVPYYSHFGEWEYEFYESFSSIGLVDAYRQLHPEVREYSWFGRTGNGYRFDHFFVSKHMASRIVECRYLHQARGQNLSDHSAMYLTMELMKCEEGK